MARLVPIDFDPFAAPRLTPVDYDPFDVAAEVERRRRAGTLPAPDQRDVAAQRRIDDRNLGIDAPHERTPEDARRLNRIGAGHEQVGDRPALYDAQHGASDERRATFEGAEDAPPAVQDTMAYIGTRRHDLDPQNYPFLYRRGQPLTQQEISSLVQQSSDEIADMTPEQATNYLFGNRSVRPQGAAAYGDTSAPMIQHDPTGPEPSGEFRERAGWDDFEARPITDEQRAVIHRNREIARTRRQREGEGYYDGVAGFARGQGEVAIATAQQTAGGVVGALLDNIGQGDSALGRQARFTRDVGEGRMQLANPGYEVGSLEYHIFNTATAVQQMAGALAVGAASKNPQAVAAGVMGMQVFAQQYDASIRQGRSPREALIDGAIYGVMEAIPEKMALEHIMMPGGRFMQGVVGRVARGTAAEAIQEDFTESMQAMYDAGVLNQDMTWGDVKRRMIDAGVAGGLTGGAVAGVHHAATEGVHRLRGGDEGAAIREMRDATFTNAGVNADATTAMNPNRADPSDPTNISSMRSRAGMETPLPPRGVREAAAERAPDITPQDHASPLPTEDIASGKKIIDDALAAAQADSILDQNGHKVGDQISVNIGGEDRHGTIKDSFVEDDEELGPQPGAVVEWHGGHRSRERISDLRDAGARVRRDTGHRIAPDIVDYLTRNGINREVALGIAAGVSAESGNNHGIRNAASGATGLGQWLGPRLAALHQRYGQNPTRQQQLEFLLYELRGGDGGGRAVLNSRNSGEALDNYIRRFMRPAAGAETEGDLHRGNAALHAAGAGVFASETPGEDGERTPSEAIQPDEAWIDRGSLGMDEGARPAAQPAPVTETRIIDSASLRSAADETGAVDVAQAGATLRTAAEEGLAAGQLVTLHIEGKPREIVSTNSRGLVDEKGQAWGAMAILSPSPNDHARLEISAAPQPTGDGTRAAPIHATTSEHVDQAAANAAQPTEAQAEAGNYQKGHVRVQGLDISIETPKGAERSGIGPDGERWSVEMPAHYGYVKRTTGADEEQVDVYVGPEPQAPHVYVVDQNDADSGKFDEHKAMIGYPSEEAARADYHDAFSDGRGPEREGAITTMTVPEFKTWLGETQTAPAADGVTTEPSAAAPRQYQMLYRPVDSTTLPDGVKWSWVSMPPEMSAAAARMGLPTDNHRYGTFTTTEPLTPEQMDRFEIRDVTPAETAPSQMSDESGQLPAAQPSEDIGQFDPAPHLEAMRSYVAKSKGSLNDTEKMGRALGLTSEQTHRVMGALAAQPNSGIRMTKGRPAGTRRILVSPARTVNGKRQAARYKTITYRPAVPARFQRVSVRTAPMHFMEWVRAQGGVQPGRHDLRNVGALARHPGVINKTGLSLDQLGERMVETGWATERPTESDVLEMLTMGSTARVYRPEDSHAVTEAGNATEEDAKAQRDEDTLRGVIDDFGIEIDEDGISRALEYMSQGKAPIQALTEAANDAAVDALETGASETGNDALLDVPEAAHGGVHDEAAGSSDSGPAEAVARPEGEPENAKERGDANAQSDQDREAPEVATDLLGQPIEQPTAKPEQAVEPQTGDMFGTRPGDERAALGKKGEGRKGGKVPQKAPGSDGGIFDTVETTGDLTQPESKPNDRPTASWVIREKATGKVVMETFDRAKVDALNTAKYEAVPIQEHLASLNRSSGIKRGTPGMMVGKDEVYLTATGRETTPVPNVAAQTDRQSTNSIRRLEGWLIENARAEAKARGDDYNGPMFERMEPKKVSQSDMDSLNEYLFGDEQPPVLPNPLKELAPTRSESRPSGYGEKNKLVTADRAAEIRAKLKAKLGGAQLNSGVDPEMMALGAELAVFHVEAGARKFADFARAIAADLGATIETLRPYLRSWYNGARDMMEDMGAPVADMDAPDEVRAALSALKDEGNAGSVSAESGRKGTGAPNASGEKALSDEPGSPRRGDRQGDQGPVEAGRPDAGDLGLFGHLAPALGDESAPGVRAGSPKSGGGDTGRGGRERGGNDRVEGPANEHVPAATVEKAASDSAPLETKRAAQARANSLPIKPGDRANIAATLPYLSEGQQDDVAFAEKRFEKGVGVLFTNGTGTGKTFTGGGQVARFVRQGKTNVLVVAPSQPILSDWQAALKELGVEASVLESTSTSGKGVTLTTWANVANNHSLNDRTFDLVVGDEMHNVLSSGKAHETERLDSFRALTNHARGRKERARRILRAKFAEADAVRDRWNKMDKRTRPAFWSAMLTPDQNTALDAAEREQDELARSLADQPKPKVVMLSATPFAYVENIDYAEGYLFDFPPEDPRTVGRYNAPDPRDQFYISHFGYRMRTGKLTKPEANVNSEIMERQFHEWLKTQGSLSARVLDVDADYDRKFVLVDDSVGTQIDDALRWLSDKGRYRPLYDTILKNFTYLRRQRLLEAIKAHHAVEHIRQHHALGRKVVVFHDFNQGAGFSPFEFRFLARDEKTPSAEEWESYAGVYNADAQVTLLDDEGKPHMIEGPDGKEVPEQIALKTLYDEFHAANPQVARMDFKSMRNPIETLTAAFPDALVYNGNVPNKARTEAKRRFNDDGDKANLIIIQAAAGEAGISLHDTTGTHQRALINLGMPTRPTTAIQQEGRIYRMGQVSDAIFRYMNTGTAWERAAFASSIAARAGTAENLALGDTARQLRQSFIQAFLDSDTNTPSNEDGKGGKESDRSTSNVTDWDKAKTFYFGQQKTRGRRDQRAGADYFATPEPLGLKMVEWANMRDGERVLEPSAGHGAIARFMPEGTDRTLIEPSLELATRAELNAPGARVHNTRFEDLHKANKFDAIVMNPPFGVGGKTAVEHLAKAATHLRNGGRLVALIPEGPSADKRFEAWQDSDAAKGLHVIRVVHLPAVTFERAGTQVRSRVVVIEKQTDAEVAKQLTSGESDLSEETNINGLFDRLENLGIADRREPLTQDVPDLLDIPETDKNFIAGGIAWKLGDGMVKPVKLLGISDFKRFADLARDNGGEYIRGVGFSFSEQESRDAFLQAVNRGDEPKAAARVGADTLTGQAGDGNKTGAVFEAAETTHAKKGIPLYVAVMANRVDAEGFNALRAMAKDRGGYWSSFRGNGAIPGFQFEDKARRDAFMSEAGEAEQHQVAQPGDPYRANRDIKYGASSISSSVAAARRERARHLAEMGITLPDELNTSIDMPVAERQRAWEREMAALEAQNEADRIAIAKFEAQGGRRFTDAEKLDGRPETAPAKNLGRIVETPEALAQRAKFFQQDAEERARWDAAERGEPTMFQRRLTEGDDPVFYSALDRAITANPTKRASAEQWAATLSRTPGVKKEELEWSGVFDWLDMQKGPVSRDDLLGVIRDGGIKAEEVVLGESDEDIDWQAVDDEGREQVGIASAAMDFADEDARRDWENQAFARYRDAAEWRLRNEVRERGAQFKSWSSNPSSDSYRELLITLPIAKGGNPGRAPATHWDQDAVVAHARFMEKRDAEGKRVLFIEEIQSDWHQKGRDEGYERALSEEELAERDAAEEEARAAYDTAVAALFANAIEHHRRHLDGLDYLKEAPTQREATEKNYAERLNNQSLDENQRISIAERLASPKFAEDVHRTKLALLERMQAASRRSEGSIPDAPFKASWPALVMKRMIRWAVDNGYERVAWTTGDEQADRYNLGQVVQKVTTKVEPDGRLYVYPKPDNQRVIDALRSHGEIARAGGTFLTREKANELFGTDLSRRMFAGEGTYTDSTGHVIFEGVDLRIGGEGMRGFYDRNLVNIANDLIKKHGGKVGTVNVPTGLDGTDVATPEILAYWAREAAAGVPNAAERLARMKGDAAQAHPGFDITPALADAARSGFPLFAYKRAQSSPVTDEEAAKIAERLHKELDRLGISDRIALQAANGLLTDKGAQGAYFRRVIKVSLDMAIDPMATMNHESVHAMKALGLFNASEWTALVKQAWADPGVAEFVRKGGYGTLSDAKRDEEAVAEFYARWRTQRLQAKGFAAKAFQRLLDFIHALGRAVAWVKGDLDARTVLRRIEKGKVGRRETGAGVFAEDRPNTLFQEEARQGFDFDAEQPKGALTPEQQRQKAEIDARQQQSKARRGGQIGLGDQAGGLFSNERDQGMLFQQRPPASLWNDRLNRIRDATGALKVIGKRDKIAEAAERLRTNFQDRMLPLLRTQTAIEQMMGRPLTEEEQPYRQEALYTGRVGDQFEQMTDNIIEPLFEAMQEEKVTVDDLESYLYARHAPERNAKLKKEGVDDGSGMSDIEAAAILNRIEKAGKTQALKNVAVWYDKLNDFTNQVRIDGGTLSQESLDQWKGAYKNYAPLRGFAEMPEEDRPNAGQSGFSVKGPESRRAFGRKSLASDILAHTISQAQEAVVRAEKNRVAISLYNLVKANPDPTFWQIHKVVMRKRINKETGMVETYPVTNVTGDDALYTVNLKVDGKAKRVTFNRHNPAALRAADAMRRINDPDNFLISTVGAVNRWLSKANTTFSPDFIYRNAIRDLETVTANLSEFDMKGLRRDVLLSYPKALAAAERAAFKREGDGEWDKAWRDYSANGGRVSFNQMETVDKLQRDIEKRFRRIQASNLSPKQASLKAWEGFKWTFEQIENFNQGVEGAARLSVYKNLVDRGVTAKQAAFIAKEISVNFNRKGVYGPILNTLYLFANASTQGNARLLMAMKHRRVQKIAASMVVSGALIAMFNAAFGGDDDDGVPYYDKISDFEKRSNLIFMIPGSGGRYIKIPMAYGYNIFPDLGRQIVDVARGRTHVMNAIGGWLDNALNSFNPIGGSESIGNFLAPTVADPVVDIYVDNRDFADRPIMPDQPAYGAPRPDSQRYWPSVPPYYRALTDALNRATGGDAVQPGWADVSPETLDYLTQQAFGAAGATVTRFGSAINKVIDGNPETNVEINDIPVLRTMVGAKPSWYDRAAFNQRLRQVQETVQRAREYRHNMDTEGQRGFVAEHRDVLELHRVATAAQREIREIRRTRARADIMLEHDRITQARHDEIMARMHAREERLIARFDAIYLQHVANPLTPQR